MHVSSFRNSLDTLRSHHIVRWFSENLRDLMSYLRVARARSILRRYFVMNAFDGAMTSLGIVLGASVTHVSDSIAVIGIVLVGGMAMAISGFAGTYMTESAERNRTLNELEDAMLIDLSDTIHGQASRIVTIIAALVDGTAPFLASLPSILPFILVILGLFQIGIAFFVSIVACLVVLFLLGAFLGHISERNLIYFGIRMVLAGVVVTLFALLL